LTGDHPARTGIITNTWIDQSVQRSDKDVYCAEDERMPGSGSSSYTVSPVHLMVPTLGELLKQAKPGSRSVAVAGKDRAAIMMAATQLISAGTGLVRSSKLTTNPRRSRRSSAR